MSRLRSLTIAAVLSALAGLPAEAQISIHARLTAEFASKYVDRGVILTNQPVIRPSLGLGLPAGTGTMGIEVAAVIEPATLSGDSYFSMAPGTKRPNVTELHPALRLSQPLGAATFSFSAGYRMFPNETGVTKDANTGSVETGLTFDKVPFAPGIVLAYEVGGITGPYIGAHVGPRVRFSPNLSLVLGAEAGYAISQEADTSVAAFAPFTRNGLTHVDLYGGWDVLIAGAAVRPYARVTFVRNPVAAPDGFEHQRKRTVTVGISLTLSGTFPKAK